MGMCRLSPGVLLLVGGSFLAGLVLDGCTTKAKARLQAREAYLAGQQQALARLQQPHEPTVTVMGQVRNSVLPWAEDLTLAKALVAADYIGLGVPTAILLVRNGRATEIDPKYLLQGHDLPLEAGDIVQLR
jgi:hypothetical protein